MNQRLSRRSLLRAGVEIYEYQPTFFHCKVMIVDGLWVSVGSTNFDARSFSTNDEANLNVYDREFAAAQARIFDEDLSHYEGDHLVFLPHQVSPDHVFDAYDRINRVFYSWPSIIGRGARLVWSYLRHGHGAARFVRWLLIALIFFKVSVFERDHAKQKVYDVSRKNRLAVRQRLARWSPAPVLRRSLVTG